MQLSKLSEILFSLLKELLGSRIHKLKWFQADDSNGEDSRDKDVVCNGFVSKNKNDKKNTTLNVKNLQVTNLDLQTLMKWVENSTFDID